ncbi:hypothetical protein EVAR_89834_1 [Eumeta japonica]|uniref:Uncharacterized protein n=1 Tax=Eumeta variegata TaxID=151549 RepID=A0A4C2AHF5_EUMVA|nr:hypothetical protein EVAR_89834_1 [Eumeta japonica]
MTLSAVESRTRRLPSRPVAEHSSLQGAYSLQWNLNNSNLVKSKSSMCRPVWSRRRRVAKGVRTLRTCHVMFGAMIVQSGDELPAYKAKGKSGSEKQWIYARPARRVDVNAWVFQPPRFTDRIHRGIRK